MRQILVVEDRDALSFECLIPRDFAFHQHARKLFALLCTKLVIGFGEMPESVEPNVAKDEALGRLVNEFDRSTDVVGVDVRDDEELEPPLLEREFFDAFLETGIGGLRSAVDQNTARLTGIGVFNPQTVTLFSGQHFESKHESDS